MNQEIASQRQFAKHWPGRLLLAKVAALCVIGLSSTAPAHAQVHRCLDASGKTIYSDAPCTTGQPGQLIERRKSQEEIVRERMQAAEANERKYRSQQAERDQQNFETQRQNASRSTVSTQQPQNLSGSRACTEAKKDLEYVSSIRTISQDEKRMRTNAAITQVNAACGSNTPLMQEPPKIIVRPGRPRAFTHCDQGACYDDTGTVYHRSGPDVLNGPGGVTCFRSGSSWNCN